MSHFSHWTEADVAQHNRRVAGRPAEPPPPADAAKSEVSEIHEPFMAWLKAQRIPYIHARTDMASTIGVGVADFHVFVNRKVIAIEAKTKTGKMTPEQLAWVLLMERQGFKVHTCRSLSECRDLVNAALHEPTH